MEKSSGKWNKIQTRLFDMVSVGVADDRLNQSYDIISTLLLLVNIATSFAMTFEDFYTTHYTLLHITEAVTVAFFAIDYVIRVITAEKLYADSMRMGAVVKYVLSGYGIIDLLSFLPYYMPFFFPGGAVVFRMFRVVRIFRLFRINAYYDSLSVIGNVINAKKTQILASVFIIILLTFASGICMYSIEHTKQPDVFENALSGIWWASSTLFTVGYGDIYPVTVLGKFFGMVITFLGVGLVAIPTGIISAGFVEEYQKVKRLSDIEKQSDVHFIETEITESDNWAGKRIKELAIPKGMIIASIIRGKSAVIPRGDVRAEIGDKLIICSRAAGDEVFSDIKKVTLRRNHDWNGTMIKDLDISRQSFIVLVERRNKVLIPYGDLVLRAGDEVLLFTKENIHKYTKEPLF